MCINSSFHRLFEIAFQRVVWFVSHFFLSQVELFLSRNSGTDAPINQGPTGTKTASLEVLSS